jgi:pyruvate/2-oxoglutarate dehydrogenase complex dihydrolipoamide acyltransferase (E2) component
MLFGQSVFQSVLNRLKEEDEDLSEDATPASHRVPGFTTTLAFDVMEGVSAPSAQPGQAYIDNLEVEAAPTPVEHAPVPPEPEPDPEPVMPAHLARTAADDIAAELAISASDTVQSLGDKRRSFAKANHPDGVHPQFRDNANKRMTIANLLIDEAIRRQGRSRSR